MPRQIVITLNDDGGFGVQGAIAELIPALGMLELAKVSIVDEAKKQAENKVQLAPANALVIPRNT